MENTETSPIVSTNPYELAAIPVWKFILYSVVSGGIYEIVWFSRVWFYLRHEKGLKIWPIWRAVFGNLFAGSLAGHIKRLMVENGVATRLMPIPIGISYLILGSLYNVPDPWSIISVFTFVPLIPVVISVNRYSTERLGKPPQNAMKWWHVAWVVIGVLCWVSFLLRAYSPEVGGGVVVPVIPVIPMEEGGGVI